MHSEIGRRLALLVALQLTATLTSASQAAQTAAGNQFAEPGVSAPIQQRRIADAAAPPGGLFGLGTTPKAPARDMSAGEPEFQVRDQSAAAAPHGLSGAAKAYGEESLLRLDAAMPAIQGVVDWTRANRTTVLVMALAVLLLIWLRTRQVARNAALAFDRLAAQRRRRRHRRHRRHHSHHHSADARGSSSPSSRSAADALAAAGVGRSSGRHR